MLNLLLLLPLHAEEGAGITPYVIGIGVLTILFTLLVGLLAFGKGREHS
jgi:hypothetical protein